jgi:hypothetical protein
MGNFDPPCIMQIKAYAERNDYENTNRFTVLKARTCVTKYKYIIKYILYLVETVH